MAPARSGVTTGSAGPPGRGTVTPMSPEPQHPPAVPSSGPDAAGLYLSLLKRCLTREIFLDQEVVDVFFLTPELEAAIEGTRYRVVKPTPRPGKRRDGRDYPPTAETMVGAARLDNVEALVVRALREGVPGDLVETGVWRGGTCIFMRAILAAHGDPDRRVWVCDSFQGLPEPDPEQYPHDESMQIDSADDRKVMDDLLAVPVEQVQANFRRYGLLDDRVRFLEGWFRDTLPEAPIDRIAVLRLDGDLYESTMDALVHLEPKVSPGGFVIVDDYLSIDACRRAVHDYRDAHGIDSPIHEIDWTGVWWQKAPAVRST